MAFDLAASNGRPIAEVEDGVAGKDRQPLSHVTATFLAASILRTLNVTYRWELTGLAQKKVQWVPPQACIFIFWHNRQLLMPFVYRRMTGGLGGVATLISRHRDGRLIAGTVKRLGFGSIAGSSTRGGSQALLQLCNCLGRGCPVAITPDGPRGPLRKLKPGVAYLASRCGVPVYPVAFGCDRPWFFSSWDKMMLPRPFARVVVAVGEPMTAPPDLSKDDAARVITHFESKLNEVTNQVDSYYV